MIDKRIKAVVSQGETDKFGTLKYKEKAERDGIDFYKAMKKIVQVQSIIH